MGSLREHAERIRRRFGRDVVWRLAQAAIAAGIAWELARQIPGHTQPFFAPIAAIVALSAEPGRRGRQAIRLLAGVTLGIGVGAIIVTLVGRGPLQIVVAAAVSLVLATAAGASSITSSQAAISAVLVIALHRAHTNLALQRLVDSFVGGGVAILIAQILFPIDPVVLVRRESEFLRRDLSAALATIALALSRQDREQAARALDRIDAIDTRRFDDGRPADAAHAAVSTRSCRWQPRSTLRSPTRVPSRQARCACSARSGRHRPTPRGRSSRSPRHSARVSRLTCAKPLPGRASRPVQRALPTTRSGSPCSPMLRSRSRTSSNASRRRVSSSDASCALRGAGASATADAAAR